MPMPFRSRLALLAVALSAGFASAQKAGPFLFSYSGQLLDGDKPVAGPIDVELKFYRQASGGDALKVTPIVKAGVTLTAEGVFQVDVDQLLDEEMNLVFDATKPTWVEVNAGGKAYPRQMLAAVPFAMKVPVQGKTVRYDEKGRLMVGPDAAPGANQFLTRGSDGEWTWATPSTSATALAGATVDTAAPAAGQVLSYDGVAGKWKPTPLPPALPAGGTNGQFLKTDGAGTFSWGTPSGAGDMQRSVYDANANSVVNDSEALGGQAPAFYRDATNLNAGTVSAARLPAATTSAAGIVELATDGETAPGVVVQGNDTRLSNPRTPANNSVDSSKILDGTITPDDMTDLTRSTLDASDGTPAYAVSVDAGGFVGIGTSGPAALLHVDQGGATSNLAIFGGGSSAVGGNTYLSLGRTSATFGSVYLAGFHAGGGDAPIGLNPYGGGVGVGLGATAPAATLEVQAPGAAATVMTSQYSSDNVGPVAVHRKARGTAGAPLAAQSSDALGTFRAQGYNGSAFAAGGDVRITASENWTGSGQGTRITFSTTSNATVTKTDRMTIADNGNVGIGNLTPGAKLSVNGLVHAEVTGYKFPDATIQGTAAVMSNGVCNGRLTLASGDPVPMAPQTNKGTIYFTPFEGNTIALYAGTGWRHFTFSELSTAVVGASGNQYDVFAYESGGIVALEVGSAWATDSARATALMRQDGVWVKSGQPTRRYLGTYRTSGAALTEDVVDGRFLFNACNRRKRAVVSKIITASWSYTSGAWRSANADSTTRVEVVAGLPDTYLDVTAHGAALGTSGAKIGIGLNTATTPASYAQVGGGASFPNSGVARFMDVLPVGFHWAGLLESGATGATFFGNNNYGVYGTIEN